MNTTPLRHPTGYPPWATPVGRHRLAASGLAVLVAAVAIAAMAIVWTIQRAGYVPCELCLMERNPYFAGVPLALATGWAAWAGRRHLASTGFAVLGLAFLASAALAAYHAGVEWALWAGPAGCSGAMTAPTSATDFMAALKTVKVVRCDAPALVILGLSLAAWNGLLSVLLAALSGYGAGMAWRTPAP